MGKRALPGGLGWRRQIQPGGPGPSWLQQPPGSPLQKRPRGAPAPGWCLGGGLLGRPHRPRLRSPRRHQQPLARQLGTPEVGAGAGGFSDQRAPPPPVLAAPRTPKLRGLPAPPPSPSSSLSSRSRPAPLGPCFSLRGLSPSLRVSAPHPARVAPPPLQRLQPN